MAKMVGWGLLSFPVSCQLLVGRSGADLMTVRNPYMQKRGSTKVGPETTLEVTTCHCHHHLQQSTNPKPAHQREANGIAKGNQGLQPPGPGGGTGTRGVTPDPDLDPGTEAEVAEESIVVVNMLEPGAAQDQEISQNIVEIAKQGLIDQNTPTDECHMTTTCLINV